MADQGINLVGSSWGDVKEFIECLPKESFFGKDYKLRTKKEAADAALEVLEKFFNMLSTVDQHNLNLKPIKEMLYYACGAKPPTINIID